MLSKRFAFDKYIAIDMIVEVLEIVAFILAFYAIASTKFEELLDDQAKQDSSLVPDINVLNKETDILIRSLESSRYMATAAMVLVCLAFILRTIVRRVV
jgi:hypothetical protein